VACKLELDDANMLGIRSRNSLETNTTNAANTHDSRCKARTVRLNWRKVRSTSRILAVLSLKEMKNLMTATDSRFADLLNHPFGTH
jgi:hypothetical protein